MLNQDVKNNAAGRRLAGSALELVSAVRGSLVVSNANPISIDGIGVFEGIFIVLMSLAGLSAAQAVAIAVVGRILQTLTLIPWWVAFVITHRDLRAPHPLSEESRGN